MDTDTVVRAHRRRQALEALEFERDREAALRGQLEEVLTELEGTRIDEAAFAGMAPADVALVRETLHASQSTPEEDWPENEGGSAAESAQRQEREEECARLRQVIDRSRRSQAALERYLEALGA